MPVRTQSLDTDPAVEERQIEAWRRMTPAGIRQRHPAANPREIELRLAALRLDRELMVRWLDWDPAREGY